MKTIKEHIPLKVRITASVYIFWFFINIIFCLIPITISGLLILEFTDLIFTNFLAFIYTLLIVSLYVFDSNYEDNWFLKWGGLFFIFGIFFLFITYPSQLPDTMNLFIRAYLWHISSGVLFIAIVISFFLNKSDLDDKVELRYNEEKKNNARKIGNRVTEMKSRIGETL